MIQPQELEETPNNTPPRQESGRPTPEPASKELPEGSRQAPSEPVKENPNKLPAINSVPQQQPHEEIDAEAPAEPSIRHEAAATPSDRGGMPHLPMLHLLRSVNRTLRTRIDGLADGGQDYQPITLMELGKHDAEVLAGYGGAGTPRPAAYGHQRAPHPPTRNVFRSLYNTATTASLGWRRERQHQTDGPATARAPAPPAHKGKVGGRLEPLAAAPVSARLYPPHKDPAKELERWQYRLGELHRRHDRDKHDARSPPKKKAAV
jgi:hypothetical protein